MKISDIPSEDLEGQLLAHLERDTNMSTADAVWMHQAITELRLRRLARSAG